MEDNNIVVIYGSAAFNNTYKILQYLDIAKEIKSGNRIGIKPNLVVSQKSEIGATTDPEIVRAIVQYLQDNNHKNIVILEGSWVGDNTKRAFEVCGYNAIAKSYGVEILDLKGDKSITKEVGNLNLAICNEMTKVDYLINVPVLKGHCQTRMTCALKNLKGCIPDSEKRRYHTLGIHKPVAYLNTLIKTNLVIVDGIYGDLDFEEGGTPLNMNRIIACKDAVMVDSYVCELMGIDIADVEYITLSEMLNVGSTKYNKENIIELNGNEKLELPQRKNHIIKFDNVVEKDSCSACYASLVHALTRSNKKNIKAKICIGQAFKNQKIDDAIGIGKCCNQFATYVKGCPPTARDIIEFLDDY